MKQRTPYYQTKRQFKAQSKELREKAKRARETGNTTQLEKIQQEYSILLQNYNARVSEIREKGNQPDEIQLPYIPLFDNRKGLDMSVEDISTEDIE
jgi:hypothetical protein